MAGSTRERPLRRNLPAKRAEHGVTIAQALTAQLEPEFGRDLRGSGPSRGSREYTGLPGVTRRVTL